MKRLHFLCALLLLVPALAQAASGPFAPPESDQSVKLVIAKLFGGAMGLGGVDLFGPLFQVFNSAVLIVGGIIAGYVLVVGTLKTAHDGEMLGKQWSSIWVPIRTALGVSLAVPMANGYCAAQILVVWLALQGVGLADKVWATFATGAIATGDLMVQPHSPRVEGMAEQILVTLVCVEAINKTVADAPGIEVMGAKPAGMRTVTVTDTLGMISNALGTGKAVVLRTIVNFGGGSVDEAACGQIVMENKVVGGQGLDATYNGISGANIAAGAASGATAGAVGGAVVGGGVGALPGAAMGAVLGGAGSIFDIKWVGLQKSIVEPTAVEAAHRSAVIKMVSDLTPLAKAIAMSGDDNYAAAESQKQTLHRAIGAYATSVKAAATGGAQQADMGAVAEAMSADGWMLAGAWYLRIVKMQNEINVAIGAVPATKAGSPLDGMFSAPVEQAQRRLKSFIQTTLDSDKMAITAYNAAYNRTPAAPNSNGAEDFNRLIKAFNSVDLKSLSSDPRNPLIVAKEMGDSMIEWAENGILAMVGGSLLGPFATLFAPILSLIVFSGISAGVFLALYLPFIPFIIWTGAFIGWIILLVEAVIAAPLWAIAKIAPSGDDIMGASKPAYMLLLSLTLRPVLMVFGIICSMVLLQPLGQFVNVVVIDAIAVGQGGSSVHWMLVMVGGVMIYAIIVVYLVTRLFALIHGIPDHVLRWIAIQDSKLAGFSGDGEQKGTQVTGAIGGIFQQGGRSVGDAAMGGASGVGGMKPGAPKDDDGAKGKESGNASKSLGSFVANAIGKAKKEGEK
jgi:conjugal transfer/type IV secretion protein DotA/TraY